MQDHSYLPGVIPINEMGLHRNLRIRDVLQQGILGMQFMTVLLEVRIIGVFCDLAQPDSHITVTAKTVYGIDRLEKGFTGDFFQALKKK